VKKYDSSKSIFDLSKNIIFIFVCLWGELLALFLIFSNFHPKIIGIIAMVLALFIQYLFLWVSKIHKTGDFILKLGISILIPVKYFVMGLLALILPMEYFSYLFGIYILSIIVGYILIRTGARKSLNKNY
jgi:hypothetical protein